MELNWLDFTLIIIISISVIIGLVFGFIERSTAIISVIGAIAAAFLFYELAGTIFIKYELVKNSSVAEIGGFIIILFLVYISIRLGGWAIKTLINSLHLSWLDKLAGAIFGLITGAGLSVLLVYGMSYFMVETKPPLSNSVVIPKLDSFVKFLKTHAPEDSKKELEKMKEYLDQKGKEVEANIEKMSELKKTVKEGAESVEKIKKRNDQTKKQTPNLP